MKRIIFSFSIIIILIFSSNAQVNNEWQWMHPKPQGNDIRFIKICSPSNWVAVGYTGTMMRTTNAGANWLVYSNYFGYYVAFLGQGKNIYGSAFADANTGIACGTQGWIARTTNSGVSWDSIGSSAGTVALWNASFGDANTVYLGGNSGIVLKSINTGINWSMATSPSGNANRTIFALDANTVFAGSLNGIIYKSTDGGSSWTTVVTGSTTSIIFGIYFFNSNTGIVSGGNGYVRYTTDGGNNWNVASVSPAATETRIFARRNPDEVYLLGDVTFLFKSTNYGVTWNSIPYQYPGQVVGLATNTMDITGNTWVIGGVNGLMNISTNSGTSWLVLANVLNAYNMYDIDCNSFSGKVWAVGNTQTGANNCILFSTDRGNNWVVQSSIAGGDFRSINMIDDNNVWAVGQYGWVIKTTNGGSSWQQINNVPSSSQTLLRVQFINLNTGWIFGYSINSIYKTTDAGNNWITQNTGSSDAGVRWASMIDANTGYYINYNITTGRIFKTTNGGNNWTEQTYPNQGGLWKLKMLNSNTGYMCGDLGRLYRTTDGSNWATINTPTTNNYTATDWYDINNGALGAGSGFVSRTTNGGQSWSVYNTGGSAVWSVRMVHPDTIWAVQGFGFIHKFMRGITPVIDWRNEVPAAFLLKQNYPNPFNPATTIELSLPKSGFVSLKIFDITGREILSVINMTLNPGIVKYNFNASNLSSGVYFYSLFVDNLRKDTKKMILLK